MAPAFIEALGLLAEGAEQVLLVFYDEPLPPFYPSAPYKLSTDQRCALALRIGTEGKGQRIKMYFSPTTGHHGEQPLQIPSFIQFLSEQHMLLTINGPRHGWSWEKHD